jgi:hypothetical protein
MVEWITSEAPVPYPTAVAEMEARVAGIRAGTASEAIWLLEHPPLYTAGTSADPPTCATPTASRSSRPGAAGNTPITGRASAWPTPCSTSTPAAATCALSWSGWRPG